ncbi:alpha/beta hydrolase [Mucilaginibacter sp. dw_454]|uniref:alpha/beta hydrolase family protein n=1 Tax=Mucilaginibacter sp. dw_454 TaxID=2720079 RepID=UPI001BD4F3ED|nr:alpha/beta hydrolase [Mucilaginibacter sp. dw_454]
MNLNRTLIFLYLLFAGIYNLSAQTLPAKTTWEAQSMGLNLTLHIGEDSLTKEKRITLDVPQQAIINLKASIINFSGDSLRLFFKTMQSNYIAKFNTDKTELSGNWGQNGVYELLKFKRVATKPELKRPQTPKPPFPYSEENVLYYNKDKSIRYGATLTIPKSEKKVPAVILITGSGLQDRDESLAGHQPFWVIADHLSRNGIAVLRVDDRSIGETTGNIINATSADFANDVLVGVNYLKNRADIDVKHIGLLGHSEGGMIAPIAAVQSKDVAFIICLAGVGIKGEDITIKQFSDGSRKAHLSEEYITRMTALFSGMINLANQYTNYTDDSELKPAFAKFMEAWLKQQPVQFLNDAGFQGENGKNYINQLAGNIYSPWERYFNAYDPATTLGKITIPVLALNGSKDTQVSAKENLAGFDSLLTSAGNKHFKTMVMPGLNHLFQHAGTGETNEYAKIEETISPEVLDIITKWIQKYGR